MVGFDEGGTDGYAEHNPIAARLLIFLLHITCQGSQTTGGNRLRVYSGVLPDVCCSQRCACGPITTLTIGETPLTYVRLEAKLTLEEKSGRNHPTDRAIHRMAGALCGVMIQKPLTRWLLNDDLADRRRHQAFSEWEIEV